MLSTYDDTIVALCTPRGVGALALIRITGTDAVFLVDMITVLADRHKTLAQSPTHTIHYGRIKKSDGSTIDHVLFLLMRAPRTFTGQDTVEISCHNNQFIIDQIIKELIVHGARHAREGEFSRRAVMQGKIDVLQAEAINEIIHATTPQVVQQSLAQLEGSLSAWVESIEKQLIEARAYADASFEFLDDETTEFGSYIKTIVTNLLKNIVDLRMQFDSQRHIRQGIRIALIGTVNAGKSSLLNALVGSQRAIVSEQPGTTRDTVESSLFNKGMYWTLIDTAGMRTTHDVLEQEGIARSQRAAHEADMVIIVYDGSRTVTCAEKELYSNLMAQHAAKMIVVQTKVDQKELDVDGFLTPDCKTSIKDQQTIANLMSNIEAKVESLFATSKSTFLLTQRHLAILTTLEQKLIELQRHLTPPIAYEIVAYHLQDALMCMSEFTGKTLSEQAMDTIFHTFCIGK